MGKLLLYDCAQNTFDAAAFAKLLATQPFSRDIRTSPDVVAAVEALCVYESSPVVVRLLSSRKMISLEGSEDSIASLAIAIAASMPKRLHVVDQAYTFDIPIEDGFTGEDLLRAIGERE